MVPELHRWQIGVHNQCQGFFVNSPDSKVHGANMGPIWGRQGPGGPHVGPMNFVIWVTAPNYLAFYIPKLLHILCHLPAL